MLLLVAVLVVSAVIIAILWVSLSFRQRQHPETLARFTNSTANLHVTAERDSRPPIPNMVKPVPEPPKPVEQIQPEKPITRIKGNLLTIHVALPPAFEPGDPYAPGFRLLQCVLVNTVDSAIPDTPIIGLVIADLFHDGKLIVPKGSEVHGRARLDRVRDRILSDDKWTIVFQTGEELLVSASALDREFNADGSGYGLNDGSGGMRGDLIKSHDFEEIKLFASTFLSGMASGLQQSQSTITGLQIPGTVRNGALAGTSQVLNEYSKEVLESIRRDGVYVRVPAGKQFYVYIRQPIELKRARVGASLSLLSTNSANVSKPAHGLEDSLGILAAQSRRAPNGISNLPPLLHLGDTNNPL